MIPIRTVEPSEASRALSTQVLAFVGDPIIRWLWPDPDAYLRHFPELLMGFGGRGAFEHGTAYVAGDFHGCAIWLPPGVPSDDEALEAMVEHSIRPDIQESLGAYFEQMDESLPREPHWHLAFIGVDPALMGQGIGGALLEHALARIDREGAIAYLESTNPRNQTLYRRHGFEVVREIQAGDGPPLTPMLRGKRD
jgi:ribosomal protein S18 acetylase RimI-like enzyme